MVRVRDLFIPTSWYWMVQTLTAPEHLWAWSPSWRVNPACIPRSKVFQQLCEYNQRGLRDNLHGFFEKMILKSGLLNFLSGPQLTWLGQAEWGHCWGDSFVALLRPVFGVNKPIQRGKCKMPLSSLKWFRGFGISSSWTELIPQVKSWLKLTGTLSNKQLWGETNHSYLGGGWKK